MTHVLVIDDSSTIRKLVELSFRGQSMTVDYARTGQEGLQQARAAPADVILLDVVLPDMRGLEVCQLLEQDERTAASVVVLMTGKDERIREQFKDCARVLGYLRKPFTAAEVLGEVARVNTPANRPAARPRAALPFEKRQVIAQAIYGLIKPHLAFIPEWMSQLGSAKPASFFARRLLSPELIEDIAVAVAGELPERGAAEAVGGPLSGQLSGFPVLELLRAVSADQRQGVLTLSSGGVRWWLYFRAGALVLATSDAVSPSPELAAEVDPAALQRAEQEQQKTGKPVLVSLSESGLVPSSQLPRVLHEHSARTLVALVDAPSLQFGWKELPALPLFVEANGREVSLNQLRLERLRRAPPAAGVDQARWVYSRPRGFSRHLRRFSLTGEERRALTLVDGKNPVARIARRLGQTPSELARTLERLAAVDLIRHEEGRASRKLVLIEAGADLGPALQGLLRRCEVVRCSPDAPELATTVRREAPNVLAVCVSALTSADLARVQACMHAQGPQQLVTVAIVDDREPGVVDRWLEAGFDHILLKPFLLTDVERILEDTDG